MVLSLVRCVIRFRSICLANLAIILHPGSLRNSSERCVFSVAAFLCCVLQAIVLRYSSDLPRRLMLLPAMIVLGGQILGWEAVDMETVMHVSTPRLRRCVIWPLQRSNNRASFLALQQFLMLPIAEIQDAESWRFHQDRAGDNRHGGILP